MPIPFLRALSTSVVELTFPSAGGGRGAFPSSGAGGTLNAAGLQPGRFYRSPAEGASKELLRPGLTAYRAIKAKTQCSINDYAVYRGVIWLQRVFGEAQDGILGPKTDAKIKAWQTQNGLTADGVYGPNTARKLLTPRIDAAARAVDADHAADLAQVMRGTVAYESGWDHGAVGRSDPRDIGVAQAHLPVHPSVSVDDALDPDFALPWMAKLIDYNLQAMNFNVRDGIAAYNLGVGGARTWIAAGRPDVWTPAGSAAPRNVKRYIDNILSGA